MNVGAAHKFISNTLMSHEASQKCQNEASFEKLAHVTADPFRLQAPKAKLYARPLPLQLKSQPFC